MILVGIPLKTLYEVLSLFYDQGNQESNLTIIDENRENYGELTTPFTIVQMFKKFRIRSVDKIIRGLHVIDCLRVLYAKVDSEIRDDPIFDKKIKSLLYNITEFRDIVRLLCSVDFSTILSKYRTHRQKVLTKCQTWCLKHTDSFLKIAIWSIALLITSSKFGALDENLDNIQFKNITTFRDLLEDKYLLDRYRMELIHYDKLTKI
jgi:hypothetical protein